MADSPAVTYLTIEGMSCQHCVNAVREALEAVPGVTPVSVNLGAAAVRLDSPDALDRALAAIADAGYAAHKTIPGQ